ncbi:hypothetical protein H9P43_002704 [Blastocladiella emersonii ATCC 22665]|nr:hypothetical protein H9P43_002671 [Blastocladiella emersonii ATCC 22665]KAI9188313.1 hypothetical protein H9P43_002704 [Blastocladiella emersonii ATCC 22665]
MLGFTGPDAGKVLEAVATALHESYLGALWCPVEAFRARATIDADKNTSPTQWTAVRGPSNTPIVLRAITAEPDGSMPLLHDLAALAAFAAAHPHVVPIDAIASTGTDKDTLLVSTPAGAGSIKDLLAKWDKAGKTAATAASNASPAPRTGGEPRTGAMPLDLRAALDPATMPLTPRLSLSWFRDVLEGVLVWHARAAKRLPSTFRGHALRLEPELVYVSLPDLTAQIDVTWMCFPASRADKPMYRAVVELLALSGLLSDLKCATVFGPKDGGIVTDVANLSLQLAKAAEDPMPVDVVPMVRSALAKVRHLLEALA